MGKRILTLVGGISINSINKKLYKNILQLDHQDMNLESFDISKLPYFSQDIENEPPDIVEEFKDEIRNCDATLFITPEYNRSFPGVLKNAIDWGSRPYGKNLWDKKIAAIMGASIGNIGTFGAQHHLRQVFAYLNMYVMPQPEFYFNYTQALDSVGNFTKEANEIIQNFLNSFQDWIDYHYSYETSITPRATEDLHITNE
ncbi:MAG: NADPH-dependent FMN reductase [Candidatus Babeliales bacterium]